MVNQEEVSIYIFLIDLCPVLSFCSNSWDIHLLFGQHGSTPICIKTKILLGYGLPMLMTSLALSMDIWGRGCPFRPGLGRTGFCFSECKNQTHFVALQS